MVPGNPSLRLLPQHNTEKQEGTGGWEEGTVTFLAKIQLADLPGTMARHCPLETKPGLYLFLYLAVLKGGLSLLGGGDVFSLEVGYFHSVLVS